MTNIGVSQALVIVEQDLLLFKAWGFTRLAAGPASNTRNACLLRESEPECCKNIPVSAASVAFPSPYFILGHPRCVATLLGAFTFFIVVNWVKRPAWNGISLSVTKKRVADPEAVANGLCNVPGEDVLQSMLPGKCAGVSD